MRTSAKLSIYGAIIAVVFAGALGVGAIAGPIDVGGDGGHDEGGHTVPTTVEAETTDSSPAADDRHDEDEGHR